jgi:organic hydroperoxide reductase OsmC/OhrA
MKNHSYQVDVIWTGNAGTGTNSYTSYSRNHEIHINGKPAIHCSSDPAFRGDADRHNPEDLFVASISTCHMLWYLHLCSAAGIVVIAYQDKAAAIMMETEDGGGHFTEVILRPQVKITKEAHIEKAIALHHDAHRLCFIANSCNFPIKHEPLCTL